MMLLNNVYLYTLRIRNDYDYSAYEWDHYIIISPLNLDPEAVEAVILLRHRDFLRDNGFINTDTDELLSTVRIQVDRAKPWEL